MPNGSKDGSCLEAAPSCGANLSDPSGARCCGVPCRLPTLPTGRAVCSRAVNKEIDYQPVRKWQLDRATPHEWQRARTARSSQERKNQHRTTSTSAPCQPCCGEEEPCREHSHRLLEQQLHGCWLHFLCQSQSSTPLPAADWLPGSQQHTWTFFSRDATFTPE